MTNEKKKTICEDCRYSEASLDKAASYGVYCRQQASFNFQYFMNRKHPSCYYFCTREETVKSPKWRQVVSSTTFAARTCGNCHFCKQSLFTDGFICCNKPSCIRFQERADNRMERSCKNCSYIRTDKRGSYCCNNPIGFPLALIDPNYRFCARFLGTPK